MGLWRRRVRRHARRERYATELQAELPTIDAFVGARTFIMPGVTIGARSIVGACSVVTKDIPEAVIAAGNPCKVLRPR